MIRILFVQPGGVEIEASATPGDTVMKTALDHGVIGIGADCNGSAACATCHVFFDAAVLAELPPMQGHEDDLLDFAATGRQESSRLSCQITVSECLEGQKIRLPDAQ